VSKTDKTRGSHTNCCIRLTVIHGSEGCHRHSSIVNIALRTSHIAHNQHTQYVRHQQINIHFRFRQTLLERYREILHLLLPLQLQSQATLPLERIGVEQYGVRAHLARHLPDDGIIFIHSFSGSRVRLPLRAPKCFIFAPSSSNISSGTSWHDATIFLASNVYIYTFY
jgi:hypothetical protein